MAGDDASPPTGWQGTRLRGAPPALIVAWVTVVTSACLASAAVLATEPLRNTAWLRLAELALLGVVFEEISAKVGRLRLLISAGPHPDMTSVWTFAGVLALPPGYSGLLVTIVVTDIWVRRERAAGQFAFRKVYTAATIVIAWLAASGVLEKFTFDTPLQPTGLRVALAVVLAVVVYTLINRLLVVLAGYLSGTRRGVPIVGTWSDNALELATLCLGALVGSLLLVQPWLCVLVLLPMVLLQRGALIKELEQAAATDAKTGLLNADAWRRTTVRELARAEREQSSMGVLIIDLDHFKAVNDELGHLVGDLALVAVGRRLTHELRQYDVVGRFGGEEFVALLPRIEPDAALAIAERMRTAIESISVRELAGSDAAVLPGLSASVGLALYPQHGTTADELLVAADAALYRAKRAGRNRVVVADAVPSSDATPTIPTSPTI